MGNGSSRGLGVIGVLTIVFIVLKLCKLITWPWLWVLAPIWIELALIVFVAFVLAIIKIASDW